MSKISGVSLLLLLALPAAIMAKSIIRFGEDAMVAGGAEAGELVVVNGSAEVAGRVNHSVIVINGSVKIRTTAFIGGDIVCLGGAIQAEPGALVSGSKVEIGGKISWRSLPYISIAKLMLLGFLFKFVSAVILLGLCLFFVMMWPEQVRCAAEEVSVDLVKSSLVGLLAVATLLPLSLGFAVTVFGLPIALALFIFLLVTGWFGVAAVAYLVGQKMMPRFSPLLGIVVGLVILKFIHFVPFAGGLLYFIATLPGLGASLLTRFGTNRPWVGKFKANK